VHDRGSHKLLGRCFDKYLYIVRRETMQGLTVEPNVTVRKLKKHIIQRVEVDSEKLTQRSILLRSCTPQTETAGSTWLFFAALFLLTALIYIVCDPNSLYMLYSFMFLDSFMLGVV